MTGTSPPCDPPSVDPELLGRLRRGDAAAWRAAFPLLWGPAVRATRLHLRDRKDADDAASRAIELLYRRRVEPSDPARLRALVVTIARRTAADAPAALQRHAPRSIPLDSLGNEAFAKLTESDEIAAVRAAESFLEALPPDDRALVRDYFLEGRTSSEIASLGAGSAADVRERVLRILRQLRSGAQSPGDTAQASPPETDFQDLWIRVREGVAPIDDVRRMDAALQAEPPRREEVMALEATCSHAAQGAAASSGPLEPPPGVLESWENRTTRTSRGLFVSPVVRLATCTLVACAAVLPWLLWPEPRTAEPFAYVWAVPAAHIHDSSSVVFVTSPHPVYARSTLVVPPHVTAWVLQVDGQLATHTGGVSVPIRPPGESNLAKPRLFTADVSPGPHRSAVLLSPSGMTFGRRPDFWWVTVRPGPYTIQVTDPVNSRVMQATIEAPPLPFDLLGLSTLEVGNVYSVRITTPGAEAPLVNESFVVFDGPLHDPESPGERLALVMTALLRWPVRAGDAWLLWRDLPTSWRTTELGLRVAAQVGPVPQP